VLLAGARRKDANQYRYVSTDSANAYENHAREFLRTRDKSVVGVDIAERCARSLDPGIDVLEIACGGGIPVTRTLMNAGLKIWALDSSPTLVEEFRTRFPGTPVQCTRVQESDYFRRKFGAVVSIGLLFLLGEIDQIALIRRVSEILAPGGRFLFTAPLEIGTWADMTTGHECRSLGRVRYEAALKESGFRLVGRYEDEGKNNHYDVERITGSTVQDAATPGAATGAG